MAVSAHTEPDPENSRQHERDLRDGLTVGVVEDSDEDYAVFQRVLSRHAAQARVKRWGRAEPLLETLEAGALAPEERPDVMIVDLTLPGIDGAELVRRLRSHPVTEALPVFVLSGSGRQRDIDRCYEAGADAYFRKSGSSDDLRSLLDTVLNAAPRRPGRPADVDPGPLLCTADRAVVRRRRSPGGRIRSLRLALRREWYPGAGLPHGVALIS